MTESKSKKNPTTTTDEGVNLSPDPALGAQGTTLHFLHDGEEGEEGASTPVAISAPAGTIPVPSATSAQDSLFAMWANSETHSQWRCLKWFVQYLVPELVDAARQVPVNVWMRECVNVCQHGRRCDGGIMESM